MPTYKQLTGTVKDRPLKLIFERYTDTHAVYVAHSLLAGDIIVEVPKDFDAVDETIPTFTKGQKVTWKGDQELPAGEYEVMADSDSTEHVVLLGKGDDAWLAHKRGINLK